MQVRVNALLCLGEVVPRLDKVAIQEVLQTLQRCTAVDHSAPTLMCSLGVVSAINKQVRCHRTFVILYSPPCIQNNFLQSWKLNCDHIVYIVDASSRRWYLRISYSSFRM